MRALILFAILPAVFLSACSTVSSQKEAMALCREAYEVYWEKDWDKVVELSTRAIKRNPDLPWAYSQRGYAHAQNGRHELAMDDLNMAIELDPEFGAAFFNRGVLHDMLGKPELAIADYTQSITLDPFGLAYYKRGMDYFFTKRYDAAEMDLRKAIEFEPNPFVMMDLAELQCSMGNDAECCNWIKKAVEGGYDDWKYIEEGDPFVSLHSSDCFFEILDSKPSARK